MRMMPVGDTDAQLIELHVHKDERGAFARTWCAHVFAEAGIDFTPVQGNTSLTQQRGSVRGMHFQREPLADAKLVRCTRGRIFDVIVDLRAGSPTHGLAHANELSEDGWTMLYVPAGFAHGFQTLSDNVAVEYLMGETYQPALYDGFRHDDPDVRVRWPDPITSISATDLAWPPLAGRIPGFVGTPS
jgi:dTDP-4-dehydrorhamnose 3,5-epimerase